MNVLATLTAALTVFSEVFGWKTGGHSREENKLRAEAEHWKAEYDKAMAGKDFEHANFALAQLRRVRDEALAKST